VLQELDEMCEPEAVDPCAWEEEHLPPGTASTLIHGDLLGQNILLGLGGPDAVIDWEYAQFGDPAYATTSPSLLAASAALFRSMEVWIASSTRTPKRAGPK
jgi:hypothetical protein